MSWAAASQGSRIPSRRRREFRRRKTITAGLVGALLLLAQASASGESFPDVPVRTLAGKHLSLPNALRGTDAFLVIGFTKRSEKETVVWRKRVQRDFSADPNLTVYPVIVIQNIPRVFHGLLIDAIRMGVPRKSWDQFLVVSTAEARWKRAVGWKGPDLAYLLLLDRAGQIVWRERGPFTESGERSLQRAVSALGATTATPLYGKRPPGR